LTVEKSILFERKDEEGFVVETPVGDVKVKIVQRKNSFGKITNRMSVIVIFPDEDINIYRINAEGKPQNKRS